MSRAEMSPRVGCGHSASNFLSWPPAGTKRPSPWEGELRYPGARQTLGESFPSPARASPQTPPTLPPGQVHHRESSPRFLQAALQTPTALSCLAGRRPHSGASFIDPGGRRGGRARPSPRKGCPGLEAGPRSRYLLCVSVKEIMAARVKAASIAPRSGQGVRQSRGNAAGKQPRRKPPRLPETRSLPHPNSKPFPIG